MAPLNPFSLPTSYGTIPFTQIRLSHIPASSPSPTPVILVNLYRPNKFNAFTDTMMEELEFVFTMADVDDRIRAIVLTGHGKMFCAGMDLDIGFKGGKEKADEHRDGGGRVVLAIHRCRKPTIVALNGSAVGIGITMTLPCAIRIASASAKIGFVFARRGIIMEACSSFFLPRLIGYSKAVHLVTTGATYPASSPLISDLFSEVLPNREDVLPRALEIAKDVAANTSVVSTALMRDMIWRNPGSAEATHLLDSKLMYELFSGSDNAEGVQSFKEKRAAKFSGTIAKDTPTGYPWWEPIDVRSIVQAPSSVLKSKL